MVSVITFWLLTSCGLTTAAGAQDRVIGLLTLPQVFGAEPCVPFTPRPIPLFASPNESKPVAHIRVDKDWTFHEDGDCTPVDVRTYQPDRPAIALPTRAYDGERRAALVVDRRGEWFCIQTGIGPLWLRGSRDNRFFELAKSAPAA
jgi:hypothetical protein